MANRRLVANFAALLVIVFSLSGCGAGEQLTSGAPNNPLVINAVDLADKKHYGVLAEEIGKTPVTFTVLENVAHMNGHMDSSIPLLVRNLIQSYPLVDTIVMNNVPGTYDFNATLEAGRLLRAACLRTVVPYEGYIASGGVHFFLAGCERIVEQGGRLGIHTWRSYTLDEDGEIAETVTAEEYPATHPKHKVYLDYHDEMDIPEEFYWKIVDTPYDDVHFLTPDELEVFALTTNDSYPWGASYRLAVDSNTRLKWSSARFYVSDGIATMQGKIGVNTADDLRSVLYEFPEVHTLQFGLVDGMTTTHTDFAIRLGRVIRDACLTTKIGKNSYVKNEVIHAYVAGCTREFESGGRLGVASWLDKGKTLNGKSRYATQVTDADYLVFYDEIGMGSLFYDYQMTIPHSDPVFLESHELYEFGIIE